MHILLPPSEAKLAGGSATSLDARSRRSALTEAREPVFRALAAVLEGPDPAAALFLPPSAAAAALTANARAARSATMPALQRYAGVVYDGLAVDDLTPAARKVADRSVLIFSGLLGVVRGGDPVPLYRVPAKAALPGLGTLAAYWRPVLAEVLPPMLGSGPVIDCRSTDYAAMWQPAATLATQVIVVRVLSPRPDGTLGVISYPSKHAKGRLAAALLTRASIGSPVRTCDDVTAAWLTVGGRDAALHGRRGMHQLDLIE